MKLLCLLFALLGLATAQYGYDPLPIPVQNKIIRIVQTEIPECAFNIVSTSTTDYCAGPFDFECSCERSAFIQSKLQPRIQGNCSNEDALRTAQASANICQAITNGTGKLFGPKPKDVPFPPSYDGSASTPFASTIVAWAATGAFAVALAITL